MRWGYKTVHFELKKDGLLGGAFLDESEMEQVLNDYGSSGWELVSMIETRDGAIAVFKQPLGESLEPAVEKTPEAEADEAAVVAHIAVEAEEEPIDDSSYADEEIYGFEETVDGEQQESEPVFEDAVEEDDEDEPGIGSIRIE